jgi:hypothetical protein
MGRCGGAGGKGANNEQAKGKGKGKGGGASQPSGRGFGSSAWGAGGRGESRNEQGNSLQKETLAVLMKNTRMQDKMLEAFAKAFPSTRPKQEPKEKKDTWSCTHCKAEKCFATRVECYKCGEPRVPTPPGLGAKTAAAAKPAVKAAVAAAPMEVEVIEDVTLEDAIAEAEENLKLLRGKETVWAKAQKQDLEGQLKVLKEQQRLARPLPARLQAATDRVAKSGLAVKDSETEVAAICEALKEARKKLEENQEKHLVALQEMEAVKQAAGAEPIEEAVKGLAASVRQALATRNIVGTDAEAIMAVAEQLYLNHKLGGGAAVSSPAVVAKMSSRPVGARASGPSLAQRLVAERGVRAGRGRSPAGVDLPRSKSTSRSPKGMHNEAEDY